MPLACLAMVWATSAPRFAAQVTWPRLRPYARVRSLPGRSRRSSRRGSTVGTKPAPADWCAKPAKGQLFRPSQQRACTPPSGGGQGSRDADADTRDAPPRQSPKVVKDRDARSGCFNAVHRRAGTWRDIRQCSPNALRAPALYDRRMPYSLADVGLPAIETPARFQADIPEGDNGHRL